MPSTSSSTHVDFTAKKTEKKQNSKTCEQKLFLILFFFKPSFARAAHSV